MKLAKTLLSTIASAAILGSISPAAVANEGAVPKGIPAVDHVFLIMMENHIYHQIIGNPNTPFINQMAKDGNLAAEYFAVGHPSLTNYLETVGGSNFGVRSDNYPDWHSTTCSPNLATGKASTDNPATGLICPIAGTGTDAETPAIDKTNETQDPKGEYLIDGKESVAAKKNVSGKTIADQLVAAGKTWVSYQEDLPIDGADLINVSDGFFTNLTDFTKLKPAQKPPLTSADLVYRYAVKHNPFVYFKSVQENTKSTLGLNQVAGFSGANGLYAALKSGNVPNFSFIVPEQCNDMHGRGNAGAFCNYDPDDNGTQAGLNPALITQGDQSVERLVTEIKASPAWQTGKSAIVLMWDENDYSLAPNPNKIVVVVDTNYGKHGVVDHQKYLHWSMLKSLEAAFGLPCLNHACDADVPAMSNMFH